MSHGEFWPKRVGDLGALLVLGRNPTCTWCQLTGKRVGWLHCVFWWE